jgi:hypothetical protein
LTIQKLYFTILIFTISTSIIALFQLQKHQQCYDQVYWFKHLFTQINASIIDVSNCASNHVEIKLEIKNHQEQIDMHYQKEKHGGFLFQVFQKDMMIFEHVDQQPYFISQPYFIDRLNQSIWTKK